MAKPSLAASFAHLLGVGRVVAEEKNDDEKKQRTDESDAEYAKRMKKIEEEDKKESAKVKDEDTDSEDGDDEKKQRPDESDEDYAKRMKKMEEEGDDAEDEDAEEEMKGKGAVAAARIRERARCSAIFASTAAAARPDIAAHLAFNTAMSRREAIALLKSVAAGAVTKTGGLAGRMSAIKLPVVGTNAVDAPAEGSASAVAQQIVASAKKARGE